MRTAKTSPPIYRKLPNLHYAGPRRIVAAHGETRPLCINSSVTGHPNKSHLLTSHHYVLQREFKLYSEFLENPTDLRPLILHLWMCIAHCATPRTVA
jgi:hypothetical protein